METIQGRKLFKGENYMRKYGIQTVGYNGVCTVFNIVGAEC